MAESNLAKTNGEFKARLTSRQKISVDSCIYKFDLPYPESPLGLLPGQHVIFQYLIPNLFTFNTYSARTYLQLSLEIFLVNLYLENIPQYHAGLRR